MLSALASGKRVVVAVSHMVIADVERLIAMQYPVRVCSAVLCAVRCAMQCNAVQGV